MEIIANTSTNVVAGIIAAGIIFVAIITLKICEYIRKASNPNDHEKEN